MAFRKSKVDNSENDSGYKKPSMSYAQLIAEALNNAPEKTLVLSDIYKAINSKYPYYELETQGWQNSIRHVLSLNENFIKGNTKSGMVDNRGGYWKLKEDHSIAKQDNIKNGNLEDLDKAPAVYENPNMSFAQLIVEVLDNVPEKSLVLWDIFKAIKRKYPYYESDTNGWQNNIRGILKSNKNFIKVWSNGWYWKLADNHSIPPLEVLKVSAGTKYQVCSECQKGFTSPDEYKYHIAKVHSFVQKGKLRIPSKKEKDFYPVSIKGGRLLLPKGGKLCLPNHSGIPRFSDLPTVLDSEDGNSKEVHKFFGKSTQNSDKINIQLTIEKDNSHEAPSDNIQDANPWLVENVQAFSFLNCPECGFKVKEENLFQDHAVKNHSMSSVLFGSPSIKTECVYIKTEPNEGITEHYLGNEPKEDIIEHQMIKTEPTEKIFELEMIESEPNEDIIKHHIVKSEPTEDIIEHQMRESESNEDIIKHHIIKSEPTEDIIELQMIESEPYEDIIKHHAIKSEPTEDIIEHQMVESEPNEDIIKHHLIKSEATEDFYKKASPYQPNRLKRSIETVDTSINIEIPTKRKKNFIFAYPTGGMQESQSDKTSDQTNIQQTMGKDNSNLEPVEDPGHKRPNMTYLQLIAEALNNAPEQGLVLSDIHKAINAKYPYYKLETQRWKETVRQNLSMNKNFIKGERSMSLDKRGWYWKLLENHSIPPHETHAVETSNLEKRQACDICDASFYMSELKKHRKVCEKYQRSLTLTKCTKS